MSEIPCPRCSGTGRVDLWEQARINVAGLADRMARRMGSVFQLNALGKAAVEKEAERLRAIANQQKDEPDADS